MVAKVLLLATAFFLPGCHSTSASDSAPADFQVHLVMRQWAIDPARVEIPYGAHVEMHVTSADVEHGIAIPKLRIREAVHPGQDTVIRFHATESGQFFMNCSVLCGQKHDLMTGWLIVKEKR